MKIQFAGWLLAALTSCSNVVVDDGPHQTNGEPIAIVDVHDELALFVEAGLTPYQALSGATRTAAEYLGQITSLGGIAVGMQGDLLLLRSNPLTDISATRQIDAVIARGKRIQ